MILAETDPRQTIKSIVDTHVAANPVKKDDGLVNASVASIWEGGPEALKYLFYVVDYDVVITFGEPRSKSVREIQDVPVHFLMSYPITVTTVDKPLVGERVCTAVEMQYKVTWALRAAIAGSAQSGVGATPAYTLTLRSDASVHKRVAGVDMWETSHVVEYQTDYA